MNDEKKLLEEKLDNTSSQIETVKESLLQIKSSLTQLIELTVNNTQSQRNSTTNVNQNLITNFQSSMKSEIKATRALTKLNTAMMEVLTGQNVKQLNKNLLNNYDFVPKNSVNNDTSLIASLQQMQTLLHSVADVQVNLESGLKSTTENLSNLSNSIFLLLAVCYEVLKLQSASQASNLMNQIIKISTETNNPNLQNQIQRLAHQATNDMQR